MSVLATVLWPNGAGGHIAAGSLLLAAGAGYLLGSLPFGHWVSRAHGVDIFEVGSRSPGATNVRRTLGPRAGNTVFLLDAAKGALAAAWPLFLVWQARAAVAPAFAEVELNAKILGTVGLVFAMLGHSFSCFTGFRGGKGVATAAGAFLVLMPPVAAVALGVWALTFFASGYVSLASILAAVTLPIVALVEGQRAFVTLVAVAVAVFVIGRHRANILRLCRGTENRAGRRGGGL
jgi:glycerol-3-phosphate acyltransferase PlsY